MKPCLDVGKPLCPEGYEFNTDTQECDKTPPNWIDEIIGERNSSQDRHGDFRSQMEALAVLEEEVDEWKYEIRHGTDLNATQEAIQIGAMALKYLEQFGV